MTALPFSPPIRAAVTPLRGRTTAAMRAFGGERTRALLPGFEPKRRDIVGITEEIWTNAAADRDEADPKTLAGWAVALFDCWNRRAFADGADRYSPRAVAHWPGLRGEASARGIAHLVIGLLASVPDGRFRVEHVPHAEEADGVVAAVCWRPDGTSSPFGADGTVEEWTVFDEVALLTQARRA